ncbi:MAG TPA: malto-oligosyltrehalose synthase [Candidatus Binatia bacterium]|nr:malto-oligosyltrehalose synthase [Candidatus Binatia bacterium]
MIDEISELCTCLERLCSAKRDVIPTSTYRLQFNSGFRFEDARRLIAYLHELGISHCYASPILKARAGSPHGYDIIDHNQLNPEIGTEEDFRRLVAELKRHGMGLLLDTVPNHMGVGEGDNPWWQDVLQNGRTSPYAEFFDIDWEPLKPELRNKVLIPVLGQPYGEDLEAGHILLCFEGGRFIVKYFDNVLPVDPRTIPLIFARARKLYAGSGSPPSGNPELDSVLSALGRLPANDVSDPDEIHRRQLEIPNLLERFARLSADSREVRWQIDEALRAVNGTPGASHSFDVMHELLEKQAYRLAFWRVSGEEINYRRFFDINDLVGLRMENPRVFAETHRLMRRFLSEGLISGLRIDHPDGLLNPAQYFARLQRLYAASRCLGAQPASAPAADGIELEAHAAFAQQESVNSQAPLYLLVEKILEPGEHLCREWPVDGTVGYDFANMVNGIFIDGRNERAFTNLYHRVIGGAVRADNLIYESRKLVMRRALASEINVLTHMLNEIANQDRRARDFTRGVLREAIRETIACFPVYRTYIDEGGHVSESDREYIRQAVDRARKRNSTVASGAFEFLRSILLLEGGDGDGVIYGYRQQLYFTLKFQQLTGPVMAKGVEDTACYVYARFISANEVGGSPAQFGIPVSRFHRGNQERAQHWPDSLLASSTHDTKRSEDVRARLNVLSEMPRIWAAEVMKWRRINRLRKPVIADGRSVPDSNEEYILYQTLVGAWPLRMEESLQHREFVRRMQQYIEKAVHEAKVNLSWLNPNPDYVAGMNTFIESILAPRYRGRQNLFWDSLQKLLPSVMYFGAINALSQTLLKLTSPGVPDIYQGQEMWDFSLVDPDNRRPVDFDVRRRATGELCTRAQQADLGELCRELLSHYRDGRIKMWVTMRALGFRRRHRELFLRGGYLPLQVTRGREDHVVAFARLHGSEMVVVATPRLSYTLMKGREEPPIGPVWGEAELPLPAEATGRRLRNIFTGERLTAGHSLLCREVFASFPVALLAVE